jgi:hypothetical protein
VTKLSCATCRSNAVTKRLDRHAAFVRRAGKLATVVGAGRNCEQPVTAERHAEATSYTSNGALALRRDHVIRHDGLNR